MSTGGQRGRSAQSVRHWLAALMARLALVAALGISAALSSHLALASDGALPGAVEPDSPRLRALAASLDAHDANALGDFWSQLDSTHSPLVESAPGNSHDVLLTFIWKADPGQVALNVQLNGWFPLHAQRGFDAFTRLRDSNVWYTSYTVPRDAQIRYELVSPKGWHASPERATYFTMDGTEYETFHDPLNPRTAHWNNTVTSFAAGPEARTSPFLEKHEGTPNGTMQTLEVDSRILQNRRTLHIYLPPGYERAHRDYGLLLVYDGNQYTTAVPTPTILDNMIAAKAIAPVVAVFLESPDRDVEFPPNDDFQRFIGSELIPQLRKHFRFSRDPRKNAVLGSSYGGIASAYTAFKHPDLFGNVLSQSGSFGWAPDPPPPNTGTAATVPTPATPATVATSVTSATPATLATPAATPPAFPRGTNPDSGWLIKRFAETPRQPIRFYLDAGTWEGGAMLANNRLLNAVLTGKGYSVIYRESPGTHHSYYWMLRLPDALLTLN